VKRSLLIAVVLAAASLALAAGAPAPKALPAKAPATRPAKRPKGITTADAFFMVGPHPRLHIYVDPGQLRKLNDQPHTFTYAQIREIDPDGSEHFYCDVGVHLKGGPGSFRRVEDKPALTVNFDKWVQGQEFHGLDKIHLNNSVQDGSYMCENLCGWIFREAGCPATRISNARVWLNDRHLGPFVIKEGFDGVFFKKYFHDKSGDLYEGSFTDIDRDVPVHLGHNLPPVDVGVKDAQKKRDAEIAAETKKANVKLRELFDAAREPDAVKRYQKLPKVLDVDRFLTFMACEAFVAHWDGYGGNRNNYRIYHDPTTDRLVFLPHGMDQMFQRPDYSLLTAAGVVNQAILNTPEFKQAYYDRCAEIRKRSFTPERVLAYIDQISARLTPLMEELGPDALRQHKEQTAGLKARVIERIANVDKQLAGPPKPLKFDSHGVAPLAGAGWEPKITDGSAVPEKIGDGGKPRLRVKCDGPAHASWRLGALLPAGKYEFEASVSTKGVVPAGEPSYAGAGLRISGGKRTFMLKGDAAWQTVRFAFEVTEPLKEVVLVCDLGAKAGTATFDLGSLTLRKK
jgi:hypothetical protein